MHVVYELFLDRVGKGSLYVEEEGGRRFALSPSVLYLVGDQEHSVGCVSPGSASELSWREEIVLFG